MFLWPLKWVFEYEKVQFVCVCMCVYVTDHTSCSLTAFHHIPFQCVSSKLFCFFSYNRPHNYSQQDDHHFSVEDFNIVCICRWLLSQDMWLEMCLCVCFCHLLNLFLHCNVKHHSFNIRRFYCVQMFFFIFYPWCRRYWETWWNVTWQPWSEMPRQRKVWRKRTSRYTCIAPTEQRERFKAPRMNISKSYQWIMCLDLFAQNSF